MGIANTRARRSVDTCIQQSAKSCLGSAALFPGGPRLNLPLTTRNLEVEVARDLYLRHPVASRIIASSRKTLNHPLDQSKSYLFHEHRRIQVVVHWCDGLDSCNPRSPSNLELYYTDCVPAPHNVQKTQLINIGRGQTEGEAASIRPQAERKHSPPLADKQGPALTQGPNVYFVSLSSRIPRRKSLIVPRGAYPRRGFASSSYRWRDISLGRRQGNVRGKWDLACSAARRR